MHYMQLPREVIVGVNILDKVGEICTKQGFHGTALVVSGPMTYPLAGVRVAKSAAKAGLRVDHIIVKESTEAVLNQIIEGIKKTRPSIVLAVGGGKDIDLGKLASAKASVPFMSIPTAASHDGIASPYASIKGGPKPYSIRAQAPIAIIGDIGVIGDSPYDLLAAGCGDIVAKFSAVKDWQLAHKLKNEYYGDYAAELALMSAELVTRNVKEIVQRSKEGVRTLVEALVSCGVAMSIAGSSRPCSGAEHLFSHALDIVAGETSLHGSRTGVGAIMCTYLHGSNWESIREFLQEIGAPSTAKELKVSPEQVVKALTMAHSLRPERYTILGETGVTEGAAEKVARATGVIG
ncbi:MAG TPA: NAD(P)-dependent glycerol-1-phosphate dehydrogenase [Candidatus Bathyarchaeia archaeon]